MWTISKERIHERIQYLNLSMISIAMNRVIGTKIENKYDFPIKIKIDAIGNQR
jgi:hypothetical protein